MRRGFWNRILWPLCLALGVLLAIFATINMVWPINASAAFRLSATLVHKGEDYTQSAVWILSSRRQIPSPPTGSLTDDYLRGEALVFKTRNGETIFALRRTAGSIPSKMGDFMWECLADHDDIDRYLLSLRHATFNCAIKQQSLQLGFFTDLSDPGSFASIARDDPDTYLKSIHASATTLKLTKGIRSMLPWLSDASLTENLVPGIDGQLETLQTIDFTTEFY